MYLSLNHELKVRTHYLVFYKLCLPVPRSENLKNKKMSNNYFQNMKYHSNKVLESLDKNTAILLENMQFYQFLYFEKQNYLRLQHTHFC